MAINRGSVSDTVGAVSAATSEQNALTYSNNAADSATAAAASASAAATSESNASSSASSSTSSASSAAASASTASTQASNASTSATNAADSATAAAASAASLTVGISEDNILQVNATVTDNDFLRIDGVKVEGRSASEVLSDIGAQPADADLTAIAGLTSAADKGIQFTGSGSAGTYDLTTAGKALLDDANASAQRTTLGLGTASTLDTGISNTNVAKFTSGVADDDFLRVDGTSIEGRSASQVLSDIGAQAADADLTAIAGLTSAADKGIQFTGSGTAGTYDLTTAGKALLDDADASAQRTTLGLGTASTLDTGISNTNVAKFTSGVADDDFLRVDGTSIEGRSASEVLTDIGGQANKNLLINGNMSVWQRSTSVTGKTTSGYFTADRWGVDIASHGTYSIARSTDVPANSGFSHSIKIDCTVADTSLASNAQVDLYQVIEAQNLLRIKGGQSTPDQLTLSFWVKSNLTGTATVELIASDASLQLSKTFTIDSANTWEKKELTYAGLTGAVNPDNGVGMYVIIWLAAGSNFTSGTLNSSTWASVGNTTNRVSSSNINIASSSSDEILFTGLQLEQNSSATDFEFENYATTLEKCKRYYHKMQAESPYDRFVMGFCVTTDDSRHPVNFHPQMRGIPTLETAGTFAVLTAAEVGQSVSSIAIDTNTDSSQRATLQVAAAATTLVAGNGTALAALNDASTYIAFTAEL